MTNPSGDLRQLEHRRAVLEGQLASAGRQQRVAIELELTGIVATIRELKCAEPPRSCFACFGTGSISAKGRCPVCRGTGLLDDRKQLADSD